MDEVYELRCELETLKMTNVMLSTRLSSMKDENGSLKKQVERLAMENSSIECVLKSRRSRNENVRQRWEFYHKHKEGVRKSSQSDGLVLKWHDVKKRTDELFAKQNSE
jgi:predicted nuclease with TOPRIM domain